MNTSHGCDRLTGARPSCTEPQNRGPMAHGQGLNTSSRRRGDVAAEERQVRDRAIADYRQRPAGARRQGQAPGSCRAGAWLDKCKPVEQMTWAPGMPALIRGPADVRRWVVRPCRSRLFQPVSPQRQAGDPDAAASARSLAGADQTHGPRMEFRRGLKTTANKPPAGAVGASGHL
jgi:hypothetical protein